MNMITPFTALFLLPVVLRETKSISNTAHVLSGISMLKDFNSTKKKERIRSN